VHFGFTENLLLSQNDDFKALWLQHIGKGGTVGSVWSEGGKESIEQFSMHLAQWKNGTVVLNGKKYYTTGSLYADWVDVRITDLNDNSACILIPRNATSLTIIDDWNGLGQV
jgi:alkylation response protein AidB-like acyl-CoA dehydrogenase